MDFEFLHGLRRLVLAGRISDGRAAEVRDDFAELAIARYPHEPLADRIWSLRHNISAYDTCFVALSEALAAPLITTDARLGSAPGHAAQVEVLARG